MYHLMLVLDEKMVHAAEGIRFGQCGRPPIAKGPLLAPVHAGVSGPITALGMR